LDAQQDRQSLESEVAKLHRRVRQQDESIARLAEALRALRRAGLALRAENRELRLAVQQADRAAPLEGRAG
jgi:hypothetical protein